MAGCALVLAIGLAPSLTLAKAVTPPLPAVHLSSADQGLVDRASAYLSGLKSAQAKFSQTDPRGAVTTGTFSLQRPGRARFAYDPPADLMVVADGVNVIVHDARLKTFDQYPLKQTPLSLLLGDQVKLTGAAAVAGVTRQGGGFSVMLRDARKQAQGGLTLAFTVSPLALSGWTVADAQGMKTTVKLSGLKTGVGLDPALFVLRDPRPHTFKP